jgi:hypothetical protein
MTRSDSEQGAAADNAVRGGAPGGAAVRWRGLASLEITARARLGMGLAIPSLQGALGWPIARPAPRAP